jgi:drug/metabolite transporter (DMT)-like permease
VFQSAWSSNGTGVPAGAPQQPGRTGALGGCMPLEAVILALAASVFTAIASVAQRRAAALAPGQLSFRWHLVGYLLHRPVWFLGIACMILGFVLQVDALRVGTLSLVQPLIATELVIVFAIIAVHHRQRVHGRDWLSALGIVVGLGSFLALARPSSGHSDASSSAWALASGSTLALAGVLTALALLPTRRGLVPSAGRKAGLLGAAAAVGFGFVAAVIKELGTHLSQGPYGVLANWSPYVLLLSGAAAMFLASNAFQAGSLAASQPGLTVVDPLVASALGVGLFGERLNLQPWAVVGEVLALTIVVGSVILLSRSPLVREERPADPEGRGSSAAGAHRAPAGATGHRTCEADHHDGPVPCARGRAGGRAPAHVRDGSVPVVGSRTGHADTLPARRVRARSSGK